LVTACRWLIVSPITETYRYPVLQPGRHALRAHFSMSQRTHPRGHLWWVNAHPPPVARRWPALAIVARRRQL